MDYTINNTTNFWKLDPRGVWGNFKGCILENGDSNPLISMQELKDPSSTGIPSSSQVFCYIESLV